MQKYQNNVQDQYGNAISGVTVTVTESPGGAVATIYSDDGVTSKSNPFTNDPDGEFTFYAADGRYNVLLTGAVTDSVLDFVLQDTVATPATSSFIGLTAAAYEYDSGVAGGDPGAGLVAFDSVTPASITEMYISDTSEGGLAREWVYNLMSVGDKLVFASQSDSADYLLFDIVSVTDSTGFWTVELNYLNGGAIFTDTDVVNLTYVPGPNGLDAITLREVAAGIFPGLGFGSFVVRDDAPNQAGFITDGSQSFALMNRIGECDYLFSTTTTDANPGNGILRYDNATPASITTLYLNNIDNFGGGMNDWALTDLKPGDIIEVVTLSNDAQYQRFRVNGAIVDGTSYQKIPVDPIDTGTLHTDATNVRVKIHKFARTLQDFGVQSESEAPTGTTQTLTYEDGPAFEVDLESVTGNITITLGGSPPASGTHGQMTVKVTQDSATIRTITWAGGTFEWVDDTAHVMNPTLDGYSIYTFETWDNGTTWFAAGANYGT